MSSEGRSFVAAFCGRCAWPSQRWSQCLGTEQISRRCGNSTHRHRLDLRAPKMPQVGFEGQSNSVVVFVRSIEAGNALVGTVVLIESLVAFDRSVLFFFWSNRLFILNSSSRLALKRKQLRGNADLRCCVREGFRSAT